MERIEDIEKIVKEAGRIILEAGENLGVEEKSSQHDLVTMYDKKVQEFLFDQLSRVFPHASFLGEEGLESKGDGNGLFIIDPIDGTTNFVKGFHISVISVGYAEAGTMKYGVIYNPFSGELFSAEKGCGAFLNGKPIHVNEDAMEHAVICFGAAPYDPEKWDYTFSTARKVMEKCVDVRRLGSAAYDLVSVACGRAGAFFECKLRPWDYAAGLLIVEEAGGTVTDLDGKKITEIDRPSSMLAGNPKCYPEMLKIVSRD